MSVDAWRKRLRDVQGLWPELTVTKRRQDVVANRVRSGGGEQPLVFRRTVFELMCDIEVLLREMCVTYARKSRSTPRFMGVGEMVSVLLAHVGWVDRHAGSGEWAARLDDFIWQAWQAIDRPPDLIRLGVCGQECAGGVTCEGELWHEPGDKAVQCPQCLVVVDVAERRDAYLRRAAAYRAPLAVVVKTLQASGVRVSLTQARQWAARRDRAGHRLLEPATVRADGTQLFALGDVLRVCDTRKSGKVRGA